MVPASVSMISISCIRGPSPRVRGEGSQRRDPSPRCAGRGICLFPAVLDLALAPPGFIREAGALAHRAQAAVTLDHIEPNAPLQLAQIDGAKMHGSGIRLREMIRSIHHAAEKDAMLDAEHVRSLVRDHFTASPEDDIRSVLIARE